MEYLSQLCLKNNMFFKWDSPPKTAFTDVPLTSQHLLERAHVASSSAPFTNNIQEGKILELFLDISFCSDIQLLTLTFVICRLPVMYLTWNAGDIDTS